MKTLAASLSILVCLAIIAAPGTLAKEKKIISGSGTSVRILSEYSVFPEDQPQHELRLVMRIDSHTSGDPDWNGATSKLYGLLDQAGVNGVHSGYQTFTHTDGGMSYTKHEGKQSVHPLGGGQVETHFEGTFQWTGGSGKYEYIRGTGTYKGKIGVDGTVTYTYEGIADY